MATPPVVASPSFTAIVGFVVLGMVTLQVCLLKGPINC